jgi:protocatechuate 3,4-dioxygenase, beta subunit
MQPLARRSLLLAAPAVLLATSALAQLVPTPKTTEGPFYPSAPPDDQDNDLIKVEGAVREAGGEALQLVGRVLDRSGKAIAGARVEIWQCDANGIYFHPGDRRLAQRDAAFQGFRTIVPVPYTGRTPHIHAKVLKDGKELLTTQLYREGFTQNDGDFLFRSMNAAERTRASMTLRKVESSRASFATEVDLVV